MERLQGDAAPEDGILRLVDDGHASLAQRALYLVALPEYRSNRGVQYLTTSDGSFFERQLYIPLRWPGTLEAENREYPRHVAG
jgi:hypothetical protein